MDGDEEDLTMREPRARRTSGLPGKARSAAIAACAIAVGLLHPAGAAAEPGDRPHRQVDDPRAALRAGQAEGSSVALQVVAGSAIPDALAWLEAVQSPAGSWGSAFEFADTATVVDALGLAQAQGQPFNLGTGWLTARVAWDNDELSRKMLALRRVPSMSLDAFAAALLDTRNAAATNPAMPNFPEGGWGLQDGYETDALTTALALEALEAAGRKAGIGVVGEALAPAATNVHVWEIAPDAVTARILITVSGSAIRLRMKQGTPPTGADPYFPLSAGFTYEILFPDSGLPFTPGTNYISVESPDPPGTAATYALTASYETPSFDTRSFAEALDYLRQAQNPDGGWGVQIGDATSLYTTLHVMQALQRWREYDFDAELAAAVSYLLGEQFGDGSFGAGAAGVEYLTALAALNLIAYEVCPLSMETEDAINALLAMRNMDGSWADEPYDTGLALRALWEYDRDGDGVFADGDCSGTVGDNPCTMGMTTGCDDVCGDYFNSNQGAVVFGQVVEALDETMFGWPLPVDAAWVKGDLADVSTYGILAGGAISYGNIFDTSADVPPANSGFYYFFRLAGDCMTASWQSSVGAEPGRDAASLGELDIMITTPADGAVLTASPATVTGTVAGADPVTVTVNSIPAMVASGTFTASVPLVRGANVLTAVGVDAASFMGQHQITVTKVDYVIGRPGSVTGSRIFTGASSTLDQAAFYTESQIGVPAGVTYTTQSVARISATEIQIGFQISVSAGASPGIYFFQVDYGLLDAGMNPLGPLMGDVFDFEIQITP
jgi:hypothetical protein